MPGGGQDVIPGLNEIGPVFPRAAIALRRHDDLCSPRANRAIKTAGIASAITADTGQWLRRVQLRQQFFCLRGIALPGVSHLDRPNIQGSNINGQMDLPPSPAVPGAMLFDLPLPLATNPEARGVDRQGWLAAG